MKEEAARSGEIVGELRRALGPSVAELRPFASETPLADSSLKYWAAGPSGRVFGVVLCSPPAAPDLIADCVATEEKISAALGGPGGVVLRATSAGRAAGLSFALYPRCRPLSSRRGVRAAQRAWLQPRTIDWLRAAVAATVAEPAGHEISERFVVPLRRLSDWERMPAAVRDAAARALARVESGAWRPRFCLMHGDLWWNNILWAPGSRGWGRFVLIDWGAALVRGFGVFDLLQLAGAMKLSDRRLAEEVRAHTRLLGCAPGDAESHLLAALAHIGSDLQCFPVENFQRLCLNSMDRLRSVVDAD